MIKLYSSMDHPGAWVAYVPDSGWLVFPDLENGWEQRKPVRGLDPIHLREMPLHRASHAGLDTAPARSLYKKVA
jgi:hypothetical protein